MTGDVKMEKIEDLEFKMTDEMVNIIIEVLMINQILKQNPNKQEIIALINQKNKLLKLFTREFQKNNINEIKKYKDLIDTTK